VRSALRPGSPGMAERASAVPRLVRAALRGDYPHASRGHVVTLGAALLYVVSPVDLVPEALFSVFGLVDDAVIAGWLAATLLNDTEAFLAWERGRSPRRDSWERAGGAGSPTAGPQDASAGQWSGSGHGETVTSRVVG
ncbi:MAG: YkvA family protein, partial [Lapillicoccus sp.]